MEKDDWIFRTDGKLWSVPLLLLSPAVREVMNDAPGAGSGYEDVELAAWENLNAFLAHVARKEIVGLETTWAQAALVRQAVLVLPQGGLLVLPRAEPSRPPLGTAR